MSESQYSISPGFWNHGGATITDTGINFCTYSQQAKCLELLLFSDEESLEPFQVIKLDPHQHRTFFFWHVLVEALPVGTCYNWRAISSHSDTTNGDPKCNIQPTSERNDVQKALLDPWATSVSDQRWNRLKACIPGDNTAHAMRAQVIDDEYDWEGDVPLVIPLADSIIYELHVRGFTRDDSSQVKSPGTFAGVIEKIPYLQSIGITHVELMPVMAFDNQHVPRGTAELGLSNYWGYSTHSFYAPHPLFASDRHRSRDEFRDMVKALHQAGIGVILDVVFNHTAEGDHEGPVINFKALGNDIFYHLAFDDHTYYRDYTGCGNTVNCNHPLVSNFLLGALHYWVEEMHVDGFRFDLASAMARGEDGEPLFHAPLLWNIELSPILRDTHIIAEAWDAAGLYQLGDFPGFRWGEWNGRYRDVMRGFIRGDYGMIPEVATRLCGSSDLFSLRGRQPWNSINFITCHDGYTLWDLVSYEHKHNHGNGEENRDGHDHNLSANYGIEGPTDDPQINQLRRRQAKNFIAILLLSQGVPMLHAGDEVLATKNGNNNTYCQDNELSWQNWQLVEDNADMLAFVKGMVQLRLRHSALRRQRFLTGLPDFNATHHSGYTDIPDITWHGTEINHMPWDDQSVQYLAFTLAGSHPGEPHLHVMINMADHDLSFSLPQFKGHAWYLSVNTADAIGVYPPEEQIQIQDDKIQLQSRNIVVLETKRI